MSVPQQASAFNNQIPPRYIVKTITRAYRVTGADYGTILNFQGIGGANITWNLVSASLVGAGFNFWAWNTTGSFNQRLTLTPNGSETIDSNSNIILSPGEGTELFSDGSNWRTVSKKTMKFYAEYFRDTDETASASGTDSIALGRYAVSSGASGAALGGYNATAAGTYSTALGYYANATGSNSMSFNALGYARETNKYAYGSGASFSGYQLGTLPLCGRSTSATPIILTSDLGAAGAANQLVLQDSSAFAFSSLVVARQQASGGTASAAWKIEGLIRREAGAASTTIVGTPTITTISNVPGWSISVSADTTNGCLAITATGAASTNISWQASVDTTEVTYA